MAHTRPGKRRDGPPGLPGGSICPFESSLGVAWQTVYQKFSHSTTLTPPIVSDPRAPLHRTRARDHGLRQRVAAKVQRRAGRDGKSARGGRGVVHRRGERKRTRANGRISYENKCQ